MAPLNPTIRRWLKNQRKQFEKPHLILVEGWKDRLLLEALTKSLGIDVQVEVWEFGGIGQLQNKSPKSSNPSSDPANPEPLEPLKATTLVKIHGFSAVQRIAMICDADFPDAAFEPHIAKRLQLVQNYFRDASLPAPAKFGEFTAGSFENRPFTVGAFAVPDCTRPGMMETLCWESIQNHPLVTTCVEPFVNACKPTGSR